MRLYSEIYVDIILTPYGQSNLDKVLNAVAKYVEMIKNTPVQKWSWDEVKQMKQFTY